MIRRSVPRAVCPLLGVLVMIAGCSGAPGSSGQRSDPSSQARLVSGRATAGPTCPVERNPPDPACAARPVAGARVATDRDGRFSVALAPGAYRAIPQSVRGLMGGARPIDFMVELGHAVPALEVSYDTGIR